MDQRKRKLLTIHKALHPGDIIDRLYASENEVGIGIGSIEDYVDASIQGLEEYIKKSKERLITAANCRSSNVSTDFFKNSKNLEGELGKTTVWIFQATNWLDCLRDDVDMTTKGKSQESN